MRKWQFAVVVSFILIGVRAWGCGGGYDPTPFIITGEAKSVLDLPAAPFIEEVDRILAKVELAPPVVETGDSFPSENARSVMEENTKKWDLEQLAGALAGATDAEKMLSDYEAMRDALTDYAKHVRVVKGTFEYISSTDAEKKAKLGTFDATPYEGLLAKLPDEFAHYVRGAIAYHKADYDGAIKEFDAVLGLPTEQRKFRSTWAAFMLGKAWARKEPARAAEYYEKARALAKEGFPDPLHLAADSVAWQADAEEAACDWVHAIRHRAQVRKHLPDTVRYDDDSLSAVCRMAFNGPTFNPVLLEDPLCRQILQAWLVSGPTNDDCIKKWLSVLEKEHPQDAIPGADRLAWGAYKGGHMELATQCVARSDPNTPYARWVKAKLLLRDGRVDEAEALTRGIPGQGNERDVECRWMRYHVDSELGVLRLKQRDYKGALDAFLATRSYTDFMYLAEWVLTPEELGAYLDEHFPMSVRASRATYYLDGDRDLRTLSTLLGKRLAGAGLWARAVPYYPAGDVHEDVREAAKQVSRDLEEGNNPALPPRTRAAAYSRAATVVVRWGWQLLPDMDYSGALLRGYRGADAGDARRSFEPTPDELARVQRHVDIVKAARAEVRHTPTPEEEKRHRSVSPYLSYPSYSNYYAATLMKKCADLLPRNDVLAAEALYRGGCYLKARDPEAADWFYKALVKRNPNLLIAQRAKKLGWFPKDFTDEVAYQPLPPRWKRYGPRFVPLGTQVVMWALF